MRMLSAIFSLFYVDAQNLLFMFFQMDDTLEKVCKMIHYLIFGKAEGDGNPLKYIKLLCVYHILSVAERNNYAGRS